MKFDIIEIFISESEIQFKMSQMEAILVLCENLQRQVNGLTNKVNYLTNKESSVSCCIHCKKVDNIHKEVQSHINFNADEIAKINSELDLVDKGMDRLFNRTNDLDKRLSGPKAQTFSVRNQNLPQFARSKPMYRSRPDQVRKHDRFENKPRLCYNCRKEGHLAINCPKPNPRLQALSEPQSPTKPKLIDQLKKKLPEANSMQPEAVQTQETEPEISVTFGTVLMPVQEDGNYKPFVYPNGSSNPMLKNYSWAELNRPVTPYGS